ncbi:MAG: glycosyltransferase family 4 protein [Acidimicrobiales bacterium]
MRIGMVCPYSLAVWGGVQAQVLGLSRALRAKGLDTQVLAPCDGPPPEPWVTPLGNSMPYAQNGSLAPLAPDPAAQLRVLGVIWDERFDLLHLHEPLAPGPTLTATVVKPVPLVGTFHAAGEIGIYRWGRPVLRRIVTRLDVRVAVSPEAAGMARRHLGGSYEILFNGIEVDRFAQAEPLPTDGPTVLFLGRHEPRKGLSVLLEAARLLPADVRLWIAGSGPETDELKARYRHDQRIEWLGPLSETDKHRRLRSADVFCVPSLGGESFGLVLLEGMAAGTPVVASDLPAYRVVARDGADALLVPTGDSDALAKALLQALSASADTVRRVERGRERSAEFAMSRLADAYLARYQRLVG